MARIAFRASARVVPASFEAISWTSQGRKSRALHRATGAACETEVVAVAEEIVVFIARPLYVINRVWDKANEF